MLGLPRYCIVSNTFSEMRVDSFPMILRKQIASVMRRVRNSTGSPLNTILQRVDWPMVGHWNDDTFVPYLDLMEFALTNRVN